MVKTASTMLELGTTAPSFSLPNVDGRIVSLDDFRSAPALVVMFICNHCPFVKHLATELASFGREVQNQGGAVVAISSNDVQTYPQDGPEAMRQEAANLGYAFPYLFDETQEVARAYRAACTPDFFVFDRNQKLTYRGQFDASRPKTTTPITGNDLRAAVRATLAGTPVPEPQYPSIGCNIKWKAGKEPEYFSATGIA
jgi:peroxiredoxin